MSSRRLRIHRIPWKLLLFAVVVLAALAIPEKYYFGSMLVNPLNGYPEVSLKELTGIQLDQINGTTSDIPLEIRQLDGKRVSLQGEMWSGQAIRAMHDFDLVYTINRPHHEPPKVQHFVQAKMLPGKKCEFFSGLVDVRGILHVKTINAEGGVASVYQLDVESISLAK